MNCPYCQEEMQEGYIPDGNAPVHWIPAGKRQAVFRFAVAKDAVVLRCTSGLTGYRAEAHFCPKCRIILAKAQ